MQLDILVFAVHPDDMELGCAGTVAKHISKGYKVGVVDLTQGELGSRGSIEIRAKEAKKASAILGISYRHNLKMEDGFFQHNKSNQIKIIEQIRSLKPKIILANAISDRHPDHGKAAKLISEACFLAGLIKIETHYNNHKQNPWRAKAVYHYIQDYYIQPDFVVDISSEMELKMKAIKAFESQFYNPNSKEKETPISSQNFLESLYARAREFGRPIGATFGEGFTKERHLGIDNLFDLK